MNQLLQGLPDHVQHYEFLIKSSLQNFKLIAHFNAVCIWKCRGLTTFGVLRKNDFYFTFRKLGIFMDGCKPKLNFAKIYTVDLQEYY